MKKYILEVTEEQAQALQAACEIGARIGMYQLHDICFLLPDKTAGQKSACDEIHHKLWEMYIHYTQGCMDDRQRVEITNVLWDLYQVIRYRLSWDRHPEGNSMSVMFDRPLRTATCNMAKIRKVQE